MLFLRGLEVLDDLGDFVIKIAYVTADMVMVDFCSLDVSDGFLGLSRLFGILEQTPVLCEIVRVCLLFSGSSQMLL